MSTESFKKTGDSLVDATSVIDIYRSIYDARINRNWPVPSLTSSNEEGKLFGTRDSLGKWTSSQESTIMSNSEMYVKAFKYLYTLSHYGESSTVKQHAGYAKTFPAFNTSSKLSTGSEIFASYFNELERYRADIDKTSRYIGCSENCISQSCALDCESTCQNSCEDTFCEHTCESSGKTSCLNCGTLCEGGCQASCADGCTSGCQASCSTSCTDGCTGGCYNKASCGTCTATCTSECLGSSSSITEYGYDCSDKTSAKSTSAGTACVDSCGTVMHSANTCSNGCGKVASR